MSEEAPAGKAANEEASTPTPGPMRPRRRLLVVLLAAWAMWMVTLVVMNLVT